MEGPSTDPVPGRRGTAGHWVARIGIGIVPILTIGLLGWVPALVAAIRTRRPVDRVLVAVSAGAAIAGLAMMVSFDRTDDDAARNAAGEVVRPDSSPLDDIGMIILIVLMIAMPVHWFVKAARWPRLTQGHEPLPYVPWHARPLESPAPHAPTPYHPTIASPPIHAPLPPAGPPNSPPVGAGSRIPTPPAPLFAPPPGSTPPLGSTPPPGTDDPAARARARLQGLSERLREQDGGNPGGSR
jgi:hypothetical protein